MKQSSDSWIHDDLMMIMSQSVSHHRKHQKGYVHAKQEEQSSLVLDRLRRRNLFGGNREALLGGSQ